jgi:hypothetical protein
MKAFWLDLLFVLHCRLVPGTVSSKQTEISDDTCKFGMLTGGYPARLTMVIGQHSQSSWTPLGRWASSTGGGSSPASRATSSW